MTLFSMTAGAYTALGTFSYAWSGSHTQCLVRNGSAISVTIDGTLVIGPVTNSAYTLAGVPLLTIGNTGQVVVSNFTMY
jgi:hypothetical protein